MYQWLRKLLFLFPPESVHHFSMYLLNALAAFPPTRRLIRNIYRPDQSPPVTLWGLSFSNPVGLAAGFDKNARYLHALECLGFSHVEIGTVTPVAQAGNPKPRLFRLPMDRALINRMGFNNDGVETIAARLASFRSGRKSGLLIGGNIGKNKDTPNEDAWKDYEKAFVPLFPHVDYFVVNVSSPNTPGLRALQEKEALRNILTRLQILNKKQQAASNVPNRPLLLKIAPDLSQEQLLEVLELAMEINLDGLVVSNTTLSRENLITPAKEVSDLGAGGLSGAPLQQRSTALVSYIKEKTGGQLPLIASGGIFTAQDAGDKFRAGASLVQVWTGFIYEGPGIVKKLLVKPSFNTAAAATAAVSERSR